jgi:superfamily I DNA and/or RNA helicase
VGDDQQLPPVVQSEEAAREGLSLSPFALLRPEAQAHGAFARLHEQFRMHEAVAAWPNEAFYDGVLTAHSTVAQHRLPPARRFDGHPIVDRDLPIVVVDSGSSATAEVEAAVLAAVLLARSGVPESQIGVVAPFRAIVAAARRLLEAEPEAGGCTVDTVDRFQGGQREAMIVCLGLSGIDRRTHAFVDDPRRLNVAFTRARAKLVVIGDLATARTLPTMAGFLHHCLDRGMPVITAEWAIATSLEAC